MDWYVLDAGVCGLTLIKLLFFTDEHRRVSRWYWRVVLFLVAVYLGHQLIQNFYWIDSVTFSDVIIHTTLMAICLLMKPEYLPFNSRPYRASQNTHFARHSNSRIR